MSQYVGIRGWYDGDITAELKRAALIYDKLVIKHVHPEGVCDQFPHVKADLKYLSQRGFVMPAPTVHYDTDAYPWLVDYDELLITNPTGIYKRFLLGNIGNSEVLNRRQEFKRDTYSNSADAFARVAALMLRNEEVLAVPLLTRPPTAHQSLPTKEAPVMQIVYDKLPFPDELTDWETILDWRRDTEATRKFKRLRVWINETTQGPSSVREVRDMLESAVSEYQAYMGAHYKRFGRGGFAAFTIATAKVIEELPKIKLSPLLEALFAARERQAQLTITEQQAPYKEIAYIAAAQERFGGAPN